MEWRTDFENAPKDGTPIVGWCHETRHAAIVAWDGKGWEDVYPGRDDGKYVFGWDIESGPFGLYNVTGWHPLPQ